MTRVLGGPKEKQKYRAFLAGLFSSRSIDELEGRLSELDVPLPFRIRLKLLYLPEGLDRTLEDTGFGRRSEPLGRNAAGYSFAGQSRANPNESCWFAFTPTQHDGLWALVAVSERPGWLRLLKGLRDSYPRLVPVFLSQRELLTAITRLRQTLHADYHVRVRELSAKESVSSDTSRKRSIREWTDEDVEQAIASVEERRQVLQSVTLDFLRLAEGAADVVPTVRCRVSKTTQLEISGRYNLVRSAVLSYLAQVGSEKIKKFSKRGMKENEYRAAPLAIRYSEPVFDRLSEIRRLVDTLARYPHSMHAIQHRNPYAFVQISDGYDGSTFDVWAVSPTRLLIVPRLRATEAAVGRLVQFVFDRFREGRVEADGEE